MPKTESEKWTERLLQVMPWGSSTCSKMPRFAPDEPGVIVKGKGCRVWDADGREYIDFRNSLGPITLGYQFPPVDNAIREQLENGIIFGHPHPLECEVAELLCEVIPCAEQARFLKTGGEAMAACIRLARFHTKRERIIQVGYSGWLNSLASGGRVLPGQIAQSAPPGVPVCLASLHHACNWNDLATAKQLFSDFPDQVAAVVVAAGYSNMDAGATFYPALRQLTQENGSLLIFDEIVTGFRIRIGGVQEYFGVVPDLAVFGKGVANGMSLSVYAGKREIMSELQKVVVSSTFGGETLSLAAAKASILTYKNEDVIGHLWRQGEKMWSGVNDIFKKHSIPAKFQGFYPCPQLTMPGDLREKFFRAAYRNGVSLYDVPYVNYSHQDQDIDEALNRIEKACVEM
jgi:glutamate-1-semialdehyde 2,1-aminomutase